MMNKKAKELGLNDTNFTSPHGLDEEEHYTTAYELAIITDYAMQNEKFCEIVSKQNATIYINGYAKQIRNTNNLLGGSVEGVNGVKTGFTNGAGRCIVLSTNREGWELIFVILGCNTNKERTKDSIKFIEYCYKNYELIDINRILKEDEKNFLLNVNKGEVNTIVAEVEEKENFIPILKKYIDKITVEKNFLKTITAPINKNEKIGEIIVKIENTELCRFDLKPENSVQRKNKFEYFKEILINIPKYLKEL